MVDGGVALASARIVVPGQTCDTSRMVDLPTPFSPTMMVIGRSNASENSIPLKIGRQKGYAEASATRPPSSHTRFR